LPIGGRVRLLSFYVAAVPALVAGAVAAVSIGAVPVGAHAVLAVLAGKLLPWGNGWLAGVDPADVAIVWLIRLPRVVVAATVGASLAPAGAMMQSLFRNPLAEPGLTGAGPGAVLGAVTVLVTGWGAASVAALPLAAIAASLLALVIVYAIATRGGSTPVTTLLLAGIAVGALLTAVANLLISLTIVSWQASQEIVFWIMGGLESRTWAHVWLSAPFVGVGLVSALLQADTLDLLLLGEETAASLGVPIEQAKRTLVLTAALLTGAAVAVAGLVGFVGLVVPHGVRLLIGPAHRRLIPASALAGAVFVIGCDLVARTARPPVEIRLGVVTALCGAPFFLFLLLRRLREAHE
jgi:iron complex transport system permease protein